MNKKPEKKQNQNAEQCREEKKDGQDCRDK